MIDQPYKGYDAKAYLIPVCLMTATTSGSVVWAVDITSERCCRYSVGDGLLVADVFSSDDSNDHQLRRLDKRKSTVMVGYPGPITRRMVFCERVWRRCSG